MWTLVLACSRDDGPSGRPEPEPPPPSEDWSRDLVATDLTFDLDALQGEARITLAPGASDASFEIGDLVIHAVEGASGPLLYQVVEGPLRSYAPGRRLDVRLGAEDVVTVRYAFSVHRSYDGWNPRDGVTFVWPYFCGNLFPCRSEPSDGLRFTMSVTGSEGVLVYPAEIPSDTASYVPAIAVGDYTRSVLGHTTNGTEVVSWTLPGDEIDGAAGTAHLVQVVDFFEQTYGTYRFGDTLGSVSVDWGPGAFGGMEHHPLWHVGRADLANEDTHAHEAAHGWFGDGVRLQCWEDFVLSEGTVSYMAARALEAVGAPSSWPANVDWLRYVCRRPYGETRTWPEGCGDIDLYNDALWSGVPYTKGACFYEDVADHVGVDVVDRAIATVYREHGGEAARMQNMLDALKAEAPDHAAQIEALADDWLRSLECPRDFERRCGTHEAP